MTLYFKRIVFEKNLENAIMQYTYVKGMFYSVIETGLGLFYFSSVIVKR